MPLSSDVHEDGLVGPVKITYPTDNDAKPKRKKKYIPVPGDDEHNLKVIKRILKYNQNHDDSGRFSSAGWASSGNYGMKYSRAAAHDPEVVRLKTAAAEWDALPTTAYKLGGKLLATEPRVKTKYIDRVVAGEPLRTGYDPHILRTDAGDIVIDGHHRVAMHSALGLSSMPAKVMDMRTSVQKYNHNHDDHGRFGSGGGGAVKVNFMGSDAAEVEAAKPIAMEALGAIGQVINAPKIKNVTIRVVTPAEARAKGLDHLTQGWYMPGEPGVLNMQVTGAGKAEAVNTLVHEYGHMLDVEQMGHLDLAKKEVKFASSDAYDNIGKWAGFSDAVGRSRSVDFIMQNADKDTIDYLMSPAESFARAFSQYVGQKSGNASLNESLTNALRTQFGQWGNEDFKPVSKSLDEIFKSQGLLLDNKPFKVDSAGVITKFNQNHGADGRFSSGGGGASITPFTAEAAFTGSASAMNSYVVNDVARSIGKVHGLPTMAKPHVEFRHDMGKFDDSVQGFYTPKEHGIAMRMDNSMPELALVHEYGHALDMKVFGHAGRYGMANAMNYPPMKAVRDEIMHSSEYHDWLYGPKNQYWANTQETFARAYSQWIATKSGNETMIHQLHWTMGDKQWSSENFKPISAALDKLFKSKGLIA